MTTPQARSALAALQRGAWQEAETYCADLLRGNPNDGQALFILGNIRARAGDTLAAEPLFERARAASPRDVGVLNSLGGVYGANGKLAEARAVLQEAVDIDPRFPWAQQNLGNVLDELGDRAGAARHYEAALRAKPDYAEALAGLAGIAEKEHRLEDGEKSAVQALALAPRLAPAAIVLARIALRRGDANGALARLRQVTESPEVRATNRSSALTLLGQAYEKLGRYDEAFSAFAQANDIQRTKYAPRYSGSDWPMSLPRIAKLTAFVREVDAGSWHFAAADRSDPVFFLGFPRSGTTLLDQVLASHPDIETVEEQEGLSDAIEPLLRANGAFARWSELTGDEVARFRSMYWRRSERALGGPVRRRVFVDKMPLYSAILPLIYRLFPDAKILFALRDPRDVAISCFEQNFAMNEAMFHFLSLDATVGYYDAVMRLVAETRRRLPLKFHQVKYEDLVGDFDRTVTGVLSFLELPWDGAVRDFAQTARKRVLKTPSAAQVVQPLYASSIGRWRNYEKHLRPHLPTLNHWVRAFDYSLT